MILYVAIHRHEYGTSVYPFWYEPTTTNPFPDSAKVVAKLGIDFEPERDEGVVVEPVTLKDAPVLTAEQGGSLPPVELFESAE